LSLATTPRLPPPGRWRLNPRRPFRLRRFEDAAVVLDEMTGDTLCVNLHAALILEILATGATDCTEFAGKLAGQALDDAERDEILHELCALGLVTSPDAEAPSSRAVSG
jgi:hypothetical protein